MRKNSRICKKQTLLSKNGVVSLFYFGTITAKTRMDRGKAMALMETHYYSSSLGEQYYAERVRSNAEAAVSRSYRWDTARSTITRTASRCCICCTERTATHFLGALQQY